MMKTLPLLFLLLLSFPSWGRVSVLISVEAKHRPLFAARDWTLSHSLGNSFRKHLGTSTDEIVIIEKANRDDLYRELRNPANTALFWVSHAGSFGPSQGLGGEDVIVDREGHNVKNLFQLTHPNLRYLAVLGCRAKPILEKLRNDGFLTPDLMIHASEKNVEAKHAIKASVNEFKGLVLAKKELCPKSFGYPVTVRRSSSETMTSLQVLNRGKVIGYFPTGIGEQTLIVHLENVHSAADLKLVVDSSLLQNSPSNFGDLSFSSEAYSGEWLSFHDKNGKVLGITEHIYRYQGESLPLGPAVSYPVHECSVQ